MEIKVTLAVDDRTHSLVEFLAASLSSVAKALHAGRAAAAAAPAASIEVETEKAPRPEPPPVERPRAEEPSVDGGGFQQTFGETVAARPETLEVEDAAPPKRRGRPPKSAAVSAPVEIKAENFDVDEESDEEAGLVDVEQLVGAFRELAVGQGQAIAKSLLKRFGAPSVRDIPEQHRNLAYAAVKKQLNGKVAAAAPADPFA